ncbi:MAG: response regulator transcription factor [Bacteroidales bacterium]|nr:response regulator transcription factor [Bacteroidales bacterium]
MKVFIIEDELMAQATLARTLKTNFPDLEIVGTAQSVRESVAWLKENKPDIIFMDVELSDGKCFEIFRKVEITSKVIMTTAYDSYAVKAFEVNSIDYLLKPVELNSLQRAIARCRQDEVSNDVNKILGALTSRPEHQWKERFLVQLNDRIVPVKTADVAYFFSEDKDNHVVTRDGTFYVIDGTLDSIMAELDPEEFFKISRSCIVAKDVVESVTKLIGGRLRISVSGSVRSNAMRRPEPDLTVSRARTDDFLEWLEK